MKKTANNELPMVYGKTKESTRITVPKAFKALIFKPGRPLSAVTIELLIKIKVLPKSWPADDCKLSIQGGVKACDLVTPPADNLPFMVKADELSGVKSIDLADPGVFKNNVHGPGTKLAITGVTPTPSAKDTVKKIIEELDRFGPSTKNAILADVLNDVEVSHKIDVGMATDESQDVKNRLDRAQKNLDRFNDITSGGWKKRSAL